MNDRRNQRNQQPPMQGSSLAQARRHLATLESTLRREQERTMTDTFVTQIEADIRTIIMTIRRAPAERAAREMRNPRQVLEHLRDARDMLNIALDLFEQEGPSASFVQQAFACKGHVQQALVCWQRMGRVL